MHKEPLIMTIYIKTKIKQCVITAAVITFSTQSAYSAGFLDKIKMVEEAISTVQKKPKVQADVGGVKVDLSNCSAKTGIKAVDNASKEKTEGKCGGDKKETQKVSAKKTQAVNEVEDTEPDR
jgi:hypothetical protein